MFYGYILKISKPIYIKTVYTENILHHKINPIFHPYSFIYSNFESSS